MSDDDNESDYDYEEDYSMDGSDDEGGGDFTSSSSLMKDESSKYTPMQANAIIDRFRHIYMVALHTVCVSLTQNGVDVTREPIRSVLYASVDRFSYRLFCNSDQAPALSWGLAMLVT